MVKKKITKCSEAGYIVLVLFALLGIILDKFGFWWAYWIAFMFLVALLAKLIANCFKK
ncbi:hypothetical protein J4223_04080 [Candidatus Woesearchaeota archaeon]|nr:hypothetical protein [Candidatus Woesearchaeota archaeon]